MTRPVVPVDGKRQDWPRLVANKANDLETRVTALERQTLGKLRFLYG